MTILTIVLNSSDSDLSEFYSERVGTIYAALPTYDISKEELPLILTPGNKYLVIGQGGYKYIKGLIHLGPRSEGFADLTNMDYLLTRNGIYFKFMYWRYRRESKFINEEAYNVLKDNYNASKLRFKDLILRNGISKKNGQPWYIMNWRIPEDPNGTLKDFINNDITYKPVTIKSHIIVNTPEEIINAFEELTKTDELMGLDYETSGFPFTDPSFYHMGVGITTVSGKGFFFNMDLYQRLARKDYMGRECKAMENEPYDETCFNTFYSKYKNFLDRFAEKCFTYNVAFEQKTTYLLYQKLYFFQEGSTINKLEGLVKKNFSLKFTAMRSLHVPSWDDDFEFLSSSIGELMEEKGEGKHSKEEVYYTNDFSKVETFDSNPSLDCETLYYTESNNWKVISENYPDYIDEFKWFIENRWGLPFACIPADILGKYCCIDSFNTVQLREAARGIYTDKAWSCFNNNLALGALLDIHGINPDEEYRVHLEEKSIPIICIAKLRLCRWFLIMELSKVNENDRNLFYSYCHNYSYIYYHPYNFNNLKDIINLYYDKDSKSLDSNKISIRLGYTPFLYLNLLDLSEWDFDNPKNNSSLEKDFMKLMQGMVEEQRKFQPEGIDGELLDYLVKCFFLLKKVDLLLGVMDMNKPQTSFTYINEIGEQVDISGYEISDWIKSEIFNFNSNDKAFKLVNDLFNYFNDLIFEGFDWGDESFEFSGEPLDILTKEYTSEDREKSLSRVLYIEEGTNKPVTLLDSAESGSPFIRYYEILGKIIPPPNEIKLGVRSLTRIKRDSKGNIISNSKNKIELENYEVDLSKNKFFLRYQRGQINRLELFHETKNIEGIYWTPTGKFNEEVEDIERSFCIPELEEVYWELEIQTGMEEAGAWLSLKSFLDRVLYNPKLLEVFQERYENDKIDISSKTIEALVLIQYYFVLFRKYEKTLGTYINGQFSKYTTYVNEPDKNLICTERGLPEVEGKKPTLRIYSPFKVCEKQSKRWSAATHTIPSKSETKRCIKAPKGFLMSYFDISGAEVRTAAFMSKSKFFMDCYSQHKDVYIEAAKIVEPGMDDDYYRGRRQVYKQILLGKFFGMGDEKLADMTEASLAESIERSKKMFDLMPEIEVLIQRKASYCSKHHGECETFLGDKMVMEGKRDDQLTRLGINQVIQGFTAVALADGFFNNIYQSYTKGEIIIRPVNVVHDSSQNYFETTKIFEIVDFYETNMRKYLYDKYAVDWDFETECGDNYYDMVDMEVIKDNSPDKLLKLTGTYTALTKLLRKLDEEGPKYSIVKITNKNKEDLELTGDSYYAKGFIPNIPQTLFLQSIARGSVQSCYEIDKSKYSIVIRKEE